MEELVWEDPQVTKTNFAAYDAMLEQIKEKPGNWGRIAIFDTSGPASNLRQSLLARVGSDARWRMRASKVDDANGKRRFGVYAIYDE